MIRRILVVVTLGAALLPLAPLGAQTSNPTFLVGAARVTTDPLPPYTGICIGGYDIQCARAMKRVRDPMYARAVAITGDAGRGETVIVVATTGIGLFVSYKSEQGANGIYDMRQQVAARLPVPADHVIVQSDHSHSGPDTIGIWGGVPASYLEQLRKAVVDAAVAAYHARVPATLSVASVTGPPTESSYQSGPNAGHDDEFRLLVARSLKGKRVLTLANYSPHATVIGSDNEDGTTGDWPGWAAEEAESLHGGFGIGLVGSIGSMDWNKKGDSLEAREAEARQRLRTMAAAATAALKPVRGTKVGVQSTFFREVLTQPVLGANYVPGVLALFGQPDIRIDRATTPPWLTGTVLGSYAGAVRLGDVFVALAPGEAFPAINDTLRQGGVTAQDHFFFGATNDFLGYMVDGLAAYQQTLQEGATYLAGCPEEALVGGDPACPDHFTLMVSPTIGTHVLCTIQDAAVRLGFTTGTRNDLCPALTVLDGVAAPAEAAGLPRPDDGANGPDGRPNNPGGGPGGLPSTGWPAALSGLAMAALVAGLAMRRLRA